MLLDIQDVECPCCGEVISLTVDGSAGSQRYIEDCHVSCRPITVMLDVDIEGDSYVRVQSEEDA